MLRDLTKSRDGGGRRSSRLFAGLQIYYIIFEKNEYYEGNNPTKLAMILLFYHIVLLVTFI